MIFSKRKKRHLLDKNVETIMNEANNFSQGSFYKAWVFSSAASGYLFLDNLLFGPGPPREIEAKMLKDGLEMPYSEIFSTRGLKKEDTYKTLKIMSSFFLIMTIKDEVFGKDLTEEEKRDFENTILSFYKFSEEEKHKYQILKGKYQKNLDNMGGETEFHELHDHFFTHLLNQILEEGFKRKMDMDDVVLLTVFFLSPHFLASYKSFNRALNEQLQHVNESRKIGNGDENSSFETEKRVNQEVPEKRDNKNKGTLIEVIGRKGKAISKDIGEKYYKTIKGDMNGENDVDINWVVKEIQFFLIYIFYKYIDRISQSDEETDLLFEKVVNNIFEGEVDELEIDPLNLRLREYYSCEEIDTEEDAFYNYFKFAQLLVLNKRIYMMVEGKTRDLFSDPKLRENINELGKLIEKEVESLNLQY